METTDQEIRREKVLIPSEMTRKEIIAKYGVSPSCAFAARKRGWLVKNYSRNQVVIDREHFHPEICYSIARQVFWKRFRYNPTAISIPFALKREMLSKHSDQRFGHNPMFSELLLLVCTNLLCVCNGFSIPLEVTAAIDIVSGHNEVDDNGVSSVNMRCFFHTDCLILLDGSGFGDQRLFARLQLKL